MHTVLILDLQTLLKEEEVKARSSPELTIIYSSDINMDTCCTPTAVLCFLPFSDYTVSYKQIEQKFGISLILIIRDMIDLKTIRALQHLSYSGALPPAIPFKLLDYIETTLQHPGFGLPSTRKRVQHIIGNSVAIRQTYELVNLLAPTPYHVIIYGETGTGKEALARLVHSLSPRSHKPFLAIDCGCLNRETATSELFGHVRGAFTDAVSDKTGMFEAADGGTLFLDEIGNLPYEIQVCLLRSIQEKVIRKVGSGKDTPVDVRIIAASNDNLQEMSNIGIFRKDLYYRINEATITIPPLRERKDDLPKLVDHIIQNTAERLNKKISGPDDEAWKAIKTYSWPGNIRELKNTLKQACLLIGSGKVITFDSISRIITSHPDSGAEEKENQGGSLKDAAWIVEREKIMTTLKSTQFNKKKAAAILNIHRKTLYNKLKIMKIDVQYQKT